MSSTEYGGGEPRALAIVEQDAGALSLPEAPRTDDLHLPLRAGVRVVVPRFNTAEGNLVAFNGKATVLYPSGLQELEINRSGYQLAIVREPDEIERAYRRTALAHNTLWEAFHELKAKIHELHALQKAGHPWAWVGGFVIGGLSATVAQLLLRMWPR